MIGGAAWPQRPRTSRLHLRLPDMRAAAWPVAVAVAAAAVGVASTRSLLVAGGLIAPLAILLAGDLPISGVLGSIFAVRVLLDERSGVAGQQSTSINPSAVLALVLLALAGGIAEAFASPRCAPSPSSASSRSALYKRAVRASSSANPFARRQSSR